MTFEKDKYYQPSRHFFSKNEYTPIPANFDLIIVAWQLKSPENIGSIMRLAGNMGLHKIVLVHDNNQTLRNSKIKKTSQSAENFITLINTTEDHYQQYIPSTYGKVALETSTGSTNIYATSLPDKMALFVGNEIKGLPNPILSHIEQSIHIPMPGPISSMNVAHATSVCAFEWYRKKIF